MSAPDDLDAQPDYSVLLPLGTGSADASLQAPVAALNHFHRNPRVGNVDAIAQSLRRNGQYRPITVNRGSLTGRPAEVLAGNHTLKAARSLGWQTIAVTWVDVDDEAATRIVLADNRTADLGEYDTRELGTLLLDLDGDLEGTGYEPWDYDSILSDLSVGPPGGGSREPEQPGPSLADRFGVPPFSVLDARGGVWRDRKRQWLALGIRSEEGRSGDAPGGGRGGAWLGKAADGSTHPDDPKWSGKGLRSEEGRAEGLSYKGQRSIADIQAGWGVEPTKDPSRGGLALGSLSGRVPTYYDQKNAAEERLGRTLTNAEFEADHLDASGASENLSTSGTSIFDPVLVELAVRWFSPPGGHVLDPFAGGSVRGIVTTHLGRSYEGHELRAEQVAANEAQRGIAPEGADLSWHQGDSRHLPTDGRPADMILSCPPYAYLEVYSDDPADLSNMTAAEFRDAHAEIIERAVARLAPNRFAVWVIGDVRAKTGDGRQLGLIRDTIDAFESAGCGFYNELIYVTPVGSLPVRAGRQFTASRKTGRTHQHVLVFVKGDGRAAAKAGGTIEVFVPPADESVVEDPELIAAAEAAEAADAAAGAEDELA